ncbi:MAG: hypothetical protein HC853_15785 [Anaerolineae bacterium]|nr:hypothetical protein [Anaerolineae bacterium]
MTTITLEVPDKLAKDIESLRAELPALLSITRELFRPASDRSAHTSPMYRAYKQMIDFLALPPSTATTLQFAFPPDIQKRTTELLAKNGEGLLNETELAELNVYAQINQVMSLKKAQAARALSGS